MKRAKHLSPIAIPDLVPFFRGVFTDLLDKPPVLVVQGCVDEV